MILRQIFERETSTYTYLLGDEQRGEALLIDPVNEFEAQYLKLIEELDLKLVASIDTHIHADHVTASGQLRELTGCHTYLGRKGDVVCSDFNLDDGQQITFGDYALSVIATPGHTDDSHCFVLKTPAQQYVFTGDTLLIRGTGRTDFQNGDSKALYRSLHEALLALDDSTIVYPGHDYRGMTMSTIGEERRYNERLQWGLEDFVENMANLNLPDPKYLSVAVPANRQCGRK